MIHKHGLAAPDPAPEVETHRRFFRLVKQAAKDAALLLAGGFQMVADVFQHGKHGLLRGIGVNIAARTRS